MEFRIGRSIFDASTPAVFVMAVNAIFLKSGKTSNHGVHVKCGNMWQHLVIKGHIYLYVCAHMPREKLEYLYSVAEENLKHAEKVDAFFIGMERWVGTKNPKLRIVS
jgi:hypothetical protein